MSQKSKKTILILANFSAGLYDFRGELLKRLINEYHVICVIPDAAKAAELRDLGCELIITPINRRGMNPREDIKLIRDYRRIIKRVKPDLVLTFTIKPNVYGGFACRRLKVPYLSVITGLGSTFRGKKIVKRLIIILQRCGLKKSSCLFFENAEDMNLFAKYRIKGKKSRLVSGSGVNLQNFRMEPYPQMDGFNFLFVGRIMKEKGIEEFLTAAEVLHSENIHFKVLGFCEEDYQNQLDQMEVRGIIEQYGFLPDVREYYKQASAIVLPTYHEGMSNVLLEASATGRPIIASNIAGCREVFDEGETGFGFEKSNSDSLIQALKKFMAIPESERALMGRKAREKMGKEFDREKVVLAYIEEINEVLK
ncbi:MAG: glycosyltransferase family 4 protein [Lachnospiraceae bacterium]|nr:glycosyltransferase family 4 protein [Lachnospiraceae bacterium]